MSDVGDKLTELESKVKDGNVSFEDVKGVITGLSQAWNDTDKTRNTELKTLQEMRDQFQSLEKGIKEVAGLNGEGTILEQMKAKQDAKKLETESKLSENEKLTNQLTELNDKFTKSELEKVQVSRGSAKNSAVSELQKLLTEAGVGKNHFSDASGLLSSQLVVGADNKTVTIGDVSVSDAVKSFLETRAHIVETKQNPGGGGDSGSGSQNKSTDVKDTLALFRN